MASPQNGEPWKDPFRLQHWGLPGCSPGADRDGEPAYVSLAAPPPVPFVPPDWTRALEARRLSERRRATPCRPESVLISIGSVGHPFTCQAACKHAWGKGGCREGANCQYCHQCWWSRNATSDEPGRAKQTASPMRVDQVPPARELASTAHSQPLAGGSEGAGHQTNMQADPFRAAEEEEAPSVGSVGHPHFCGKACKYRRKTRGCKDGRLCVRCHACVWRHGL